MDLTVLGSSASCPAAGDACSGYLVRGGGARVLLDCGSGVLGNLMHHAAPPELNAIFVSHMHPDHYIDLVALRYGARYGTGDCGPISVFLPPGGSTQLQRVARALSKTQPFFDGVMHIRDYEPGETLCFGEMAVTPRPVVHGIPSHAIEVYADGRRLVHSSDTVVCDELIEASRGVDMLLAEATLGGGAPVHHEPRTHMSALEAGEVATRAEARRLVLTHFWYTADRSQAVREAGIAYNGIISAARPHARYWL